MGQGAAVELRFHNRPLSDTLRLHHDWTAMAAEHVVMSRPKSHDFTLQTSNHYLAFLDARRKDGETVADGLPRSTTRDGRGKLIFVPAGCRLDGWAEPTASPVVYTAAYIDPSLCAWLNTGANGLAPALHFEHPLLGQMMLHLKRVLEHPGDYSRMYVEAFAVVLLSETIKHQADSTSRRDGGDCPTGQVYRMRGGLAGWQRRAVCEFIEEHLDEEISLADLATIARLSPFHFCRAFKEAVGKPPHRYQMSRRMERAKVLLSDHNLSVSDVAAAVGYSSGSHFSEGFKKVTGQSPGKYRRN
jgi:AraC family transcriptional regulator